MAGPGDEIAAGAGGRGHLRASHADREGRGGTAELLSGQPLLILLAAAMIARVEQAGA